MKNVYGEVALITGASSGIGQAIAQAFALGGMRVYGAHRRGDWSKPEQRKGAGYIQSLPMDVCDEASVQAGIQELLRREGRLDVLVNCAGSGIAGALEQTSAAEAAFQMGPNFFGMLNVCRAALPLLRASAPAMIINISSVAGFVPVPFQGLYSASKYAVEAYSQTLRMELAPLGVRVCLLQPGDTCTGFTDSRRFAKACTEQSIYYARCMQAVSDMERSERNGRPPSSVAKAATKLLGKRNPPVHRCIGWEYKLLRFAARLLPDRAFLAGIRKFYHA